MVGSQITCPSPTGHSWGGLCITYVMYMLIYIICKRPVAIGCNQSLPSLQLSEKPWNWQPDWSTTAGAEAVTQTRPQLGLVSVATARLGPLTARLGPLTAQLRQLSRLCGSGSEAKPISTASEWLRAAKPSKNSVHEFTCFWPHLVHCFPFPLFI